MMIYTHLLYSFQNSKFILNPTVDLFQNKLNNEKINDNYCIGF
jgi:hypothetical protein